MDDHILESINDRLIEVIADRILGTPKPEKPANFWRHVGRETAVLTAGGATEALAISGFHGARALKNAGGIGKALARKGAGRIARRFARETGKRVVRDAAGAGAFGAGLGAAENVLDRRKYNQRKRFF
jgi:hypothetical protein